MSCQKPFKLKIVNFFIFYHKSSLRVHDFNSNVQFKNEADLFNKSDPVLNDSFMNRIIPVLKFNSDDIFMIL